jgi:hypothetical protein
MEKDAGAIGRLVAGAGGLALVVSVFLTWYSLSLADMLHALANQVPAQFSGLVSGAVAQAGVFTLTWSGWHAVEAIRFVLLLVGLAVLFGSAAPSTSADNRRATLLLVGGALTVVLVAYRIASPPDALNISPIPGLQIQLPGTGGALSRVLHVQLGAWVALFGGALVMLGGWSQLSRRQTVPAVQMPSFPVAPASKAPPSL